MSAPWSGTAVMCGPGFPVRIYQFFSWQNRIRSIYCAPVVKAYYLLSTHRKFFCFLKEEFSKDRSAAHAASHTSAMNMSRWLAGVDWQNDKLSLPILSFLSPLTLSLSKRLKPALFLSTAGSFPLTTIYCIFRNHVYCPLYLIQGMSV